MEPLKPMKPLKPMEPMEPMKAPTSGWWPAELGSPGSSGSQHGWRYAYFPEQRQLVVERDGQVAQYETGDHAISGVRQSQGSSNNAAPVFTSQHGEVRLGALRKVSTS